MAKAIGLNFFLLGVTSAQQVTWHTAVHAIQYTLPLSSYVSHCFTDSTRCRFVVLHNGFHMEIFHIFIVIRLIAGTLLAIFFICNVM